MYGTAQKRRESRSQTPTTSGGKPAFGTSHHLSTQCGTHDKRLKEGFLAQCVTAAISMWCALILLTNASLSDYIAKKV